MVMLILLISKGVKGVAQLEFEPVYYEVIVQHVDHYGML